MTNKKICFVSLVNIYLLPYLKKYTTLIGDNYDIIYWNRHNIDEKINQNRHPYERTISENASKLSKLFGYIGFSLFARKILKKNNYDYIVLLSTNSGMFLWGTLMRKYKRKFVLDIRDYTYENNRLFYYLEKKLIYNSNFTVISSEGFRTFLPVNDYFIAHNELNISKEVILEFRSREKGNVRQYILTYIGLIRFHEQNKKIIDVFMNDSRFLIQFIGADALYLDEYVKSKKATNIILIDRFEPKDTFKLLKNTDFILNLYGNKTPLLDYALSNKLYYSAKLGIPILVCPKTYMSEISNKYKFGFDVDLTEQQEHIKNTIISFYKDIIWEDFYQHCDSFLNLVQHESELLDNKIRDVFECDNIDK